MAADTAPARDHWNALRALSLAAWSTALIGYFGPWISGPRWGAALSWNAYDLFDLMRLLPEVETGTLSVALQTLHLPLLGLAVLLPTLGAARSMPWERWTRTGLGILLALATLPPYPEILTAWRMPGWRVPFWWAIGCAGLCLLGGWLRPRLEPILPWATLGVVALASIPAIRTLCRLLPALSRLHNATVRPGWGMWLCNIGLWVIGGLAAVRGWRDAAKGS